MNPEENSRALNPADDNKLQENYTTEPALKASFSMFRNSFDTEPAGVTTLAQLAADIRGGRWQAQVERLRAMNAEEYSQNKRNLEAAAFGGTFTRRKKDALLTPSRLVVIDIDHVEGAELTTIKARLLADRHTALCFVSPSGKGLKAVLIAEFTDDATFKQAWRAIANYLKDSYSLNIDESGKNIDRLCYVSYDPEAYYNPDAVQFVYEVAAVEVLRPVARPTAPIFIGNHQQRYVLSVINGEIESIETAPRGGGNNALNVAVMKIGQFYYLGLFDKEAIRQHLTAAYLRRGGSFKNQAEADATFESGWRAGVNSPRALPEGGNHE
jgi:hypothetical protein